MDLARSYDGAQGFPHWILAGTQSKARGRQGRSWLSPAGAFAASLVMRPRCTPAEAAQRSFVAACALLRAAYEAGLAWLAIAGVLASVIGAYYYIRIVYFMYFGADSEPLDTQTPRRLTLILVVSTALITVGAAFSLFGIEPLAQLAAESLAN